MAVENQLAQYMDSLIAVRRDLHRNPELLYDVHETAARVAAELRSYGVDEVHEGIGKTGVVGVIRGQNGGAGRMIALRSDMDALPIHEDTGADWASLVPGKMHACGHDGHMTMLLGAARFLSESRSFAGTVIVLFQPAEEGGAGARAMLEDGLLDRFPIDEFYGMHTRPGLDVGKFATASGPMMGSVDEIVMTITGAGGHAAAPETTIDPVPVMAALIQAVQGVVARNLDPLKAGVVSITEVSGGDAFNVIPQAVRLRGTVRTLDEATRSLIEARLQMLTTHIAAAFGAEGKLDYIRHYPVLVNEPVSTGHMVAAAAEVAGAVNVSDILPPTLGGEDFAFFLNERPGAFIFIGNGPSAALHNPRFDFNDDAIGWGSSFWINLARQRLGGDTGLTTPRTQKETTI